MKLSKLLFVPLVLSMLVACDSGASKSPNKLKYVSFNQDRFEFDTSLFYGNINVMKGADPSLIYVPYEEDNPDSGYYYSYVTGVSTINSWRTKDMTNWQYLGASFRPNLDYFWAYSNFWAPSVLFDKDEGAYYMFYSATLKTQSSSHYMSVARSENPCGPFVELGDGNSPVFNFNNVPKGNPLYEYHDDGVYPNGYFSCIDGEAFIDPVTKKKYLLFVHDKGAGYSFSDVYIMEMNSWTSPKYETITRLTECERVQIGSNKTIDDATVNEGPFMHYHNGLYYLTYSNHVYTSPSYQVRQAISKSPMGPFTKIDVNKGGTVISTEGISIYTASSGHHSFIEVGDDLYIGYHTFLNDTDISESRKIKFDKVKYVVNQDGLEVMYVNGPTVNLQPLPSKISGYENKALAAKTYVSNINENSNKYWLNDDTIMMHEECLVKETIFNRGNSNITLLWDEYVDAKAIMVYNSREWTTAFTQIDNIVIYFKDSNGETYTCETGEIAFNFDIFSSTDFKLMHAASSSTIEFNNLSINRIDISFSKSNGPEGIIAIPEVVVLGMKGGN